MKKIIYSSGVTFFSFLIPLFVFGGDSGQTLGDVLNTAGNLVSGLIPLMMALALVVFFYGLVTYLAKTGDSDGQKNARGLMLYGIIILFVMASIWGLVNILGATFGIDKEQNMTTPGIEGLGGE